MYYFCGKKTIEKHFRSIIMQEYIIFFIIILIITIYIYSYYKYPTNISILQTRPFEFNSDMLLEKQPIVIENNDSKLNELKEVFFRFNPSESFNLSSSDNWHYNRYKYITLQLKTAGEILLCPPRSKMIQDKMAADTLIPDPSNTNLLAIQAKSGEIIIIPLHWHYLITNKLTVSCIGIHDLITYFLP